MQAPAGEEAHEQLHTVSTWRQVEALLLTMLAHTPITPWPTRAYPDEGASEGARKRRVVLDLMDAVLFGQR